MIEGIGGTKEAMKRPSVADQTDIPLLAHGAEKGATLPRGSTTTTRMLIPFTHFTVFLNTVTRYRSSRFVQ